MREHYPQVANEQFKFETILPVEDNEEDEDERCLSTTKKNATVSSFPPINHMYSYVEN